MSLSFHDDARAERRTADPRAGRGAVARTSTVEPGRTGGTCLAVIGLRGVPGVIGGIETHCELLYPALVEIAPNLDVVLLARRAYVAQPRFPLGKAVVRALPALLGRGPETVSHTLLALLYARWRLKSRLVHLHGIGPAFFAPLARLLGMRTVVTHHAADFQRRKWGGPGRSFLRLGEAMAARFADRVICVSDALRRDFLSRYPAAEPRTVTIRHGARVDAVERRACAQVVGALGLTPGDYLLAVGRLEETKRFDDLIAAHDAAGPDALPLVIVGASIGDASYEERLRAAAGPGVVFAGFRTGIELAALYRSAALFVHPSEMEGFGLVVLEAMVAGLPVRLSDIPPHREFGLDERCYFQVGDRDTMHSLFRTPPSSPDETAGYADIIERHSLDASITAHANLFHEVLADR